MAATGLLLAVAGPGFTAGPGQAQIAAPAAAAPSGIEDGVDSAIDPGDDFFGFANGDWLRGTALPPGQNRWGARQQMAERAQQQVAQLIRNAGALPGGRKVADFHAAWLDEAGIEAKGLAPVLPLLDGIRRLRDKTALARWLGGHLQADVDPVNLGVYDSAQLFGLAVSFGLHGEPNNIAYLVQGGLGLHTREAYLDDAAPQQALRQQYRDLMAQLLLQAGFDAATQRADAVLALETAIARGHASAAESADDRNADKLWRLSDLAAKAPGLDWPVFFAAAGLSRQADIVAWQAAAVQGSAALVASQPLAVWQDYLRVQVLYRYAELLPQAMAQPAQALRSALAGTPPPASREQRALAATQQALPDAVGRLYVRQHFPAATKARLQALLGQVVAAFSRRLAAVPWMSAASKDTALAKLKTLYFGIGHPERWPDDSALRISAHDAVGNQQRVAAWRYRQALAQLGRPVDRRAWAIAPQTPGGLLNFQLNAYNFAAALLQPPKFDPGASDAANYGAIGAIFAHEISHFVDTLGADYDTRGASRHWWTAEDMAGYDKAAQPLVDQFAAYRPLPDLAIDGKRTLGENIADLGGLAAAFDAHRLALGHRATDPQTLRRQDRQFFIGFARAWRITLNDEALRAQLAADNHAPERYRVFSVRNLDAWYPAFDVRPGHKLYLAPEARVRIW